VQPHAPGHTQMDGSLSLFSFDDLVSTVKAARSILPASIKIQVPPNLALAESVATASDP